MGRSFAIAYLALIFASLMSETVSGEEANAMKKSQKHYFNAAKEATRKEEFQRAIRILERNFHLEAVDKSTPVLAWELAAFNFEKLGRPKQAIANLYRALKAHYPHSHDKNVQQYRADGSADDLTDLPPAMLSVYFKLARNYAAIAIAPEQTQNSAKVQEEERQFAIDQAIMFAEICINNSHRESESERILKTVQQFKLDRERSHVTGRFFAGMGYASWQDKLTLVSTTNQSETELLATSEGPCIGGGYERSNYYWGWKLEGCMAFASANVGENSQNVDYFQQGVAVNALIGGPAIFWRPQSGDVSIGLELPIMIRSGNYTTPEGAFALENTSLMAFGLGTEWRWSYRKVDFSADISKFFGLPSVLWMAGVHYHF